MGVGRHRGLDGILAHMLTRVPVMEGPVVGVVDGIAMVVREPLEFVGTVTVEKEPKLRMAVVRIRPSGFLIVEIMVTLATRGRIVGSAEGEVVFVVPGKMKS